MSENDEGSNRPQLRLVSAVSKDAERAASKKAGETKAVIQGNAYELEDEYSQFYMGGTKDAGILAPTYNPRQLDRLAQENNALLPCVEAMVTNVDGTGYDFENPDEEAEDAEDDEKIEELRAFFAEPWPGVSFTTIRKDLRRDLERTGNAYLEILRNPQDEVVFLRRIDAKMMRLMKLDDAVPVEKIVKRKGKEVKITVMQRERRFVQLLNGVSMVYFREFGSSRDLNKRNGAWAPKGQRLPATERATEVIHFTVLPDASTPYGVPRWINQLPSVLGSRKAEEYNLEFFDNGGIPPVLILLQGGTLQPATKNALDLKMGKGTASAKNRVQVLEIMPSGGTFNSPNQARVTVERFGAERQDDSMFENYDEKCETRVRRSFRLPPIFIGAAEDYSFASAFASYTVAEAQVFKPERDEFDEIMTIKLLKALGYGEYKFVSNPLVIEDTNLKLKGIEMAKATGAVDLEDVLYEINEATGTNIKYKEPEQPAFEFDDFGNPIEPEAQGKKPAAANDEEGTSKTTVQRGKKTQPVGQGYTGVSKAAGIAALRLMTSLRKRDINGMNEFIRLTKNFDQTDAEDFDKALTFARFVNPHRDLDGLAELSAATVSVIGRDGLACGCGHVH